MLCVCSLTSLYKVLPDKMIKQNSMNLYLFFSWLVSWSSTSYYVLISLLNWLLVFKLVLHKNLYWLPWNPCPRYCLSMFYSTDNLSWTYWNQVLNEELSDSTNLGNSNKFLTKGALANQETKINDDGNRAHGNLRRVFNTDMWGKKSSFWSNNIWLWCASRENTLFWVCFSL